jgi:hypothetical protein
MEKKKGVSALEGKSQIRLLLVLGKLKDALNKRGASTIRGLGIVFRCMDSVDRNRKADKEEFRTGLSDIGVPLAKAEVDVREQRL